MKIESNIKKEAKIESEDIRHDQQVKNMLEKNNKYSSIVW